MFNQSIPQNVQFLGTWATFHRIMSAFSGLDTHGDFGRFEKCQLNCTKLSSIFVMSYIIMIHDESWRTCRLASQCQWRNTIAIDITTGTRTISTSRPMSKFLTGWEVMNIRPDGKREDKVDPERENLKNAIKRLHKF